MKVRALVLALSSTGLPAPAQAATDCNQLFVYAVQQFCNIAPNGQSICQPVGLVGPAPSCALPGSAPSLTPMPLAPASVAATPYNPFLTAPRAPNPYLATPGITVPPYIPPQPFPLPPQAVAPVTAPAAPAPVTPPSAVKPAAAPAKPANPYLQHSGVTVQPFIPYSPPPAPVPASAPAAKPAAVLPLAQPAPAAEMPKPAAPAQAKPEPTAAPQPAAVQPTTPVAEAAKDAVVLFRFNSSRLTPDARKRLDAWVADAPKGARIFVTGHADRIGSARYNKKLSLRRAKSVRAYLVSKGVSARNVVVGAKGYSAPVKNCEGKVSRAIIVCLSPNRRVEVKP